jgi:hypothetical protein
MDDAEDADDLHDHASDDSESEKRKMDDLIAGLLFVLSRVSLSLALSRSFTTPLFRHPCSSNPCHSQLLSLRLLLLPQSLAHSLSLFLFRERERERERAREKGMERDRQTERER